MGAWVGPSHPVLGLATAVQPPRGRAALLGGSDHPGQSACATLARVPSVSTLPGRSAAPRVGGEPVDHKRLCGQADVRAIGDALGHADAPLGAKARNC